MKKSTKIIGTLALVIGVNASLFCTVFARKMSEIETDTKFGLNGSFEQTKNGLPVNWQMYTPRTTKNGDFDIVFDQVNAKEGKQSLLLSVRQCSPTGGWHSPGLAREIAASPGDRFTVRMWVKNSGSKFRVNIKGVNALKSAPGHTTESKDEISEWRLLEYTYQIPNGMKRLRIELNVLSAGSFWVDHITVQKQ